MRKGENHRVEVEQMLAAAWRQRPTLEPSAAWCAKVMQAIRAEPGGPQAVRFRVEAGMAWRGALVTAAAAVLVAAVGLWLLPSDAQLARDFQQDSALSAWVLRTGESR